MRQPHFSTLTKRWVINSPDEAEAQKLHAELKTTSLPVCRLLISRGIKTFDEAKKFFRPSLDDLHDPFLMKNMEKAVYRIKDAIDNKEKILVYGDYDVDGTTAVALVYSFLRDIYSEIDFYIPNRYTEGYGISFKGIDFAAENNFKLIIALDCGIKSVPEVAYANSKGVDFIICDHHRPGEVVPDAVAVLDPQQDDCPYPFKELSGCGIGFKLVEAYCQANDLPFEKACENLDMVVVSIAADIVPVVDENRTLAYFGLKKFNENPSRGMRAMKELMALEKEYTISDLVFTIGPRINAAGRIDDARHAVKMLIAEEEDHANDSAEILHDHNITRKKFDEDITNEALEILYTNDDLKNKKSTVLFRPHWHKGVIGIVASRLIDHFYRPTIMLTESNGFAVGSARSVRGFDIYNAIQECAPLLDKFGGHKYAAGLSIKLENVNAFIQRFEEVVASTIEESMLTPEIEIDLQLELGDINEPFFKIIQQFEPFGPGNMKPVFTTQSVSDSGHSKVVGENHIKLSLKKNGARASGIAFRASAYYEKLKNRNGNPAPAFDICYTIEENIWNGNTSLQLNVKDIKMK